MTARLVVSLSGITEPTLGHCADLAEELARRAVPLSLLLAPREHPRAVVDWVHRRTASGDALLMHGYGTKAARLPAHEAGLRLIVAGAALDHTGLRADGFAPPRWLASPGTVAALRHTGFSVCAELGAVRELRTGRLHRGRVQGLWRGEFAEPWWCRALVLHAARATRRGGLVRLAVDASHLAATGPRQALIDAVDLARHHGATGVTYPDLMNSGMPPRSGVRVGSWTFPRSG